MAWYYKYKNTHMYKNILFGDINIQSYFCIAKYRTYDNQISSYKTSKILSISSNTTYGNSTRFQTHILENNGRVIRDKS